MIAPQHSTQAITALLKNYLANTRKAPQHIYYFRDGVSEGQYQQVLDMELVPMKEAVKAVIGADSKWTVTICSKRHHIRFFPQPGPFSGPAGNVHAGTIVERDVTHPAEYDFCKSLSHSYLSHTDYHQT
jgi:eukaryotic translation initiation factor 2C